MFWAYNTTSPQIDITLCKEDLTLQELLDQENVLQELKTQNLKLIEFLIKPDILRELVSLIITEPSPDSDLNEQYRYPNLACELLTSDLPALNERLASEEILNKLYQFLQNEPPLNPLLSSYFSRTLSILISRKSEQNWFSYQYTCLQALEFLKAKEEFIQLLLKHMGTSSIMDLMLNLITLVEGPELKQSLWNWLQSQDVIPSLISLLGPHSNPDCQTNTAFLLSSIIQKLRENLVELNDRPVLDPILHLLESADVMELVLNTVFRADVLCDTSIQSGVDVVLVLLQPYLPGDARCRLTLNYSVHDKSDSGLVIPNNNNNNKINNNNCNNANGNNKKSNCTINVEDSNNRLFVPPPEMIAVVLPFIGKFREILMNPPKREPIQLTTGIISPSFGKARLLVAKLIGVLISLNSSEINEEIKRCDIPELLLDLFYAYSSNNFLHTEVEKVIAHVIDFTNEYPDNGCRDEMIVLHLLKKCRLIDRILEIWQKNEEQENNGHSRKGYMGHVIRIATLIHNEMLKNSVFNELLTQEIPSEVLARWNTFISDDLTAIIKKHSTCLGGIRPKLCQSSDNSFEESVSSKDLRSEVKYFGSEDDQNAIFTNHTESMDYDGGFEFSGSLTEEEEECLEEQTKMFDLMCQQKWQSFTKGLDNLEENDEDNEPTQRYRWGEVHWGSDEENVEEDALNSSDPWSRLGNVSDPWASSTSNEASDDSWNNSSNSSNWAKFDENFSEAFSANSSGSGEAFSATCPELNPTIDQYELYGGGGSDSSTFQNMDILKNFSNVRITSAALDEIESPTPGKNPTDLGSDSNWVLVSNESENENGSKNYDAMQGKYNCFRSDEMLNLASICGNTLAEKLANAENDIRNKDEEEQQQHHHRPQNERLMNSFVENNEQTSCNSSECDIRLNCDGMLEEERLREQNTLFSSPQDCLTENSYDFYTAENSTSDAESSVEFGDAENSLELEEEDSLTEPCNLSPSNELSESSTEHDTCDGQESFAVDRDLSCENVDDQDRVQISEDSSNDDVKQKAEDSIPTEMDSSKNEEDNPKINSKLYNSMNGVDEHGKLKDHDEIKETVNSNDCDPSKDQVDVSILTDEPV